jgi:Mrp family chromosome partitioning ATPase
MFLEPRPTVRVDRAISTLYYTIASQRLRDDPVALQFVSPDIGAGTSFVASEFAAFAARSHGGLALLVDCSITTRRDKKADKIWTRPGLIDAFATTGSIDDAVEPVKGVPDLHIARLTGNPEVAKKTNTDLISAVLVEARRCYQFTALDTPSLEDSVYTLTFARASDGVVLVLAADSTKGERAEAAVTSLEHSGGKILGLVFNKRRRHMPKWLYNRL